MDVDYGKIYLKCLFKIKFTVAQARGRSGYRAHALGQYSISTTHPSVIVEGRLMHQQICTTASERKLLTRACVAAIDELECVVCLPPSPGDRGV